MKICPKCRVEFEEKFNFCLQDGTALIDAESPTGPDEQVTVARRTDSPARVVPLPPDDLPLGDEPGSGRDTPQSTVRTEEWHGGPSAESSESAHPISADEHAQGAVIGSVNIPVNEEQESRPAVQPGEQKSYLGIIVGVIALLGLLLFGTAIGGAFLYYRSQMQDEVASANTNHETNSASDENTNIDLLNENSQEPLVNSNIGNSETDANVKTETKPTPTATLKPSPTRTISSPTPSPAITPQLSTPTPAPTVTRTPRPARTQGPTRTPTPVPTPTRISGPDRVTGGIVNGRAISLPKPPYPAAARAVRASGAVRVAVLIGKTGRVISAQAISGHPLLRGAAVSAAQRATFRPTLVQGRPVEVAGSIIYNFRP